MTSFACCGCAALGVLAVSLFVACGDGASNQSEGGAPNISIGEERKGVATYYDFADGSGACSFPATPGDLDVAALNAPDYGVADYCGACAEVTGPSGNVTVRIVDLCPECESGHLDLSPSAFEKIALLEQGRVEITWRLAPCVVDGPVAYQYKDGANPWWTAVQVRNHRLPITKFEVDKGRGFVELKRADYNYFLDESGFGEGDVQVRITASSGETLVDTLPFVEEFLVTDGAKQFR